MNWSLDDKSVSPAEMRALGHYMVAELNLNPYYIINATLCDPPIVLNLSGMYKIQIPRAEKTALHWPETVYTGEHVHTAWFYFCVLFHSELRVRTQQAFVHQQLNDCKLRVAEKTTNQCALFKLANIYADIINIPYQLEYAHATIDHYGIQTFVLQVAHRLRLSYKSLLAMTTALETAIAATWMLDQCTPFYYMFNRCIDFAQIQLARLDSPKMAMFVLDKEHGLACCPVDKCLLLIVLVFERTFDLLSCIDMDIPVPISDFIKSYKMGNTACPILTLSTRMSD